MLIRSCGFSSMVSWTNSASLGCRGNEAVEDLQALTAQVKKLMVRTFIAEDSGRLCLKKSSRCYFKSSESSSLSEALLILEAG
jgi:hypothetical protein